MTTNKANTIKTSPYADIINSSYHTDEDHFVTIGERLQEMYAKDSDLEMMFRALAEGMVGAMGYESYHDMVKDVVGMGSIQYVPASEIDINDYIENVLKYP